MNTRVAVIGGTGKTGRAVTAALSARGAEAVPLGRAAWIDLAGALAGCDAAYVIAPNMHPDEAAYVEQVTGAALRVGVSRVVLHSVASPYVPAMPHHLGKAQAEDVVRRSGLTWSILQPGAYVQNFAPGQTIRLPYRADAPFGFAHLDDVGEVAARVLLEDGHEGATYELRVVPRHRRRPGPRRRLDRRGGPAAGLGRERREGARPPGAGLAARDVRLLRPARPARGHAPDAGAARATAERSCGALTGGVQWKEAAARVRGWSRSR